MENDEALKSAHRAMWERGDYPRTARDLLKPLGRELVAACGIGPDMRVLDIAAGAGNAAIQAAEAGAQVVASDLAPELLESGSREAADRGIALEWVEADAEALPFGDDEFDVTMSCIGAMFAPDHQRAADEMLRVCRPGGTIGMVNWDADGSIAEFFGVFAPYLPPLPPGASPPLMWGDPKYVDALFGDRVERLRTARRQLAVDHFETPEDFCSYYKSHFGPTIAAYARMADQPQRVADLDRDFLEYAKRTNHGPQNGHAKYFYDYMIITARIRA